VDTLIFGISPEEGVLMGRPSKFSPEFREQAVELVRATGKTIAEVARDLSINDTTLGTGSRRTGLSGVCRTAAGCCR
jgi:transposase